MEGEQMQNYKRLKVWEKAHRFTVEVYRVTREFPKPELFGLTAQLRRACVSVTSSIGEGAGRGSTADFARFLDIATGSVNEAESLLLVARDVGYLLPASHQDLETMAVEVRKMLWSLLNRLRPSSEN